MKFVENALIKFESGELIRILHINRITSIIYVINMKGNRWPYVMTKDELLTAYKNKKAAVEEIDEYCRAVPEDELSEMEKTKRNRSWEIVSYFKSRLDDEEYMFISAYRKDAMKDTMKVFNLSYNGLKNILIKYFIGAMTKSSLIPNYFKCGASGKERVVGTKKRGRPRKESEKQGLNVDDNIKRMFKTSLNRYYYNQKNNSLKTVYELTLRDYFSTEAVDDRGKKIPVLNEQVPTYNQFLYWYKQMNDSKKEIITRRGTRTYQQNYRSIIGIGNGDYFQIDSTQFDIYLVSESNRDLIVGRPTLHLVVCAYTRVIMGMSMSFESLNNYSGEMIALYNSMTSKKDFCSKYGINIEDSEWPFSVPTKILADRGALNSKQIENAIENLGITVQQTPPYRADYKGIIEQAFNQLNLKVKPFLDGVVVNGKRGKERGAQDYRLQASLTIEEFTKIIIKTILFHNNYHVLTDYALDEGMMEANVEKIPIKIWEYYTKHSKGSLRVLPKELIKTHLLPTDTASITPRGLVYRKLAYASDYTLKQGLFQKARVEGNKKVKICYNPMDVSELYMFDESNQLHKLSLLEHLMAYSNKGIDEIDALRKQEKEVEDKGKEKELQEKLSLYSAIEGIAKEAKKKTEAERDYSKSKSQRIKGIKENQHNEKMLQRELMKNETKPEIVDEPVDDELALFRIAGEDSYDE